MKPVSTVGRLINIDSDSADFKQPNASVTLFTLTNIQVD
jgi:hypothetical protein